MLSSTHGFDTSFWPPYCPGPDCPQSRRSQRDGFLRHGHYQTSMQQRRVPRFLCRRCRRTVSSQTFDRTYRLRRPNLEEEIIRGLAQGQSQRQVAQTLGINRKTVSRRLLRARNQNWTQAVAEPPVGVDSPESSS